MTKKDYYNMNFREKIIEIQKVLPFKFRVGSANKAKTRFLVLPYIDARDCMDRLDTVFWHNRQRLHKDVWWKSYCSIWLYDGSHRIYREDVWEKSKVAQEKWEASDAFKRACVNWWLWRFLYTMPAIYISSDEEEANKRDMTKFVKTKHKDQLLARAIEYNAKIDEKSKYQIADDDDDTVKEELNTATVADKFWK